jgi:hypothetical protein
MAAGYERNALGEYLLFGLVTYGPTTAKLRGIRLREIDSYTAAGNRYGVVVAHGTTPPSPDQVRENWAQTTAMDVADSRNEGRGFNTDQYLDALAGLDTSPRHASEPAEEFYARIVRAHETLAEVTDKPTAALAALAGVPVGTAASWVSRARARAASKEDPQ